MKDTGIARRLDELGRIVLPKELRKELKLAERDSLQIFTEAGTIVLKPHRTACFICGEQEDSLLAEVSGCAICAQCAALALQKLEALPLLSHKGA